MSALSSRRSLGSTGTAAAAAEGAPEGGALEGLDGLDGLGAEVATPLRRLPVLAPVPHRDDGGGGGGGGSPTSGGAGRGKAEWRTDDRSGEHRQSPP